MNVTITDRKVEDHLKTEAARAAYIRAAVGERWKRIKRNGKNELKTRPLCEFAP